MYKPIKNDSDSSSLTSEDEIFESKRQKHTVQTPQIQICPPI